MRRSAPLLLIPLFLLLGCKGIDQRRKDYGEQLQKSMPEGCEVVPKAAAYNIDCKGAKDQPAAVEAVAAALKSECSSLKDLKIGSVAVFGGKAGFHEAREILDGKCDLQKK